MSKIEFNASKLKDIIDRSKAEASKRSNNSSSNVSIAFLPEGKHKIRLFFDKAGDLYRTAVTHKGPKGQVLCPDYLAERDTSREYPECEFCKQAEIQDDWKLNRRFNIMTFGQLIHTIVLATIGKLVTFTASSVTPSIVSRSTPSCRRCTKTRLST